MERTEKQVCVRNQNKCLNELLHKKGLTEHFIEEIYEHGLTEDIMRRLQCCGFEFDEIVSVAKMLQEDEKFNDSCACTFKTESTTTVRTNHADFLMEHLREILPKAMKEIVIKKPFDPIEYLGHWLLYYRECEERERRRRELEAELREERLKYLKPAIAEPSGEEESLKEFEKVEDFAEDQ